MAVAEHQSVILERMNKMTVGALLSIIFGVIIIIVGVIYTFMAIQDEAIGIGITCFIVSFLIGIALISGAIFYLNTETGKRAIKDMESNLDGGINRVVNVYDVNGEIIKTYEGKFDVEVGNAHGSPYILFDDENNKRHIVYYTTGTIFIDEK